MQETQPTPTVEVIDARKIYSQLRQVKVFSELREEDAACLGEVQLVHAPAGSSVYRPGDQVHHFWAVIEGEVHAIKKESAAENGYLLRYGAGESFGEVPLLTGRQSTLVSSEAIVDSIMVGIDEEDFWKLLASCPVVRAAIISNMDRRLQNYQAFALHREKLMSLGTLSAGLMHELNNPGTAARRAAAQLRENMVGLQRISLRFCEVRWQDQQIECMKRLQSRALTDEKPKQMSAIDESDAEELLAEWLEEAGVANSWKMAPTLTAIGLKQEDLECARNAFVGESFSDTLGWLTAVVSNIQLVGTIEESITRISELVMAVKKYSHSESAAQTHTVDIHDGLRSTLTILMHKFRPKALKIDKQFAPDLPIVQSRGVGLTQVWTNLLDNAIDASPDGGTIHIRTWVDGSSVAIGIADEGEGISEEHRQHIFDPFFTTKPVGVGTGLGLDIAHRIVVGHYKGEIGFTSEVGKTEFIVHIPIASMSAPK